MRKAFVWIMLITVSACMPVSTPVEPEPSQPPPTAEPTVDPTVEPSPDPTSTNEELAFPPEDPESVVLDFTEDICAAEWSNSGEYLACPGDAGSTSAGFSEVLNTAALQDGSLVQTPSVLMIPPHGSRYGGLFGAYPEVNIYPGDHFKAVLACEESSPGCSISYALHYYDSFGNFQQVSPDLGPSPINSHDPEQDSWTEIDIDLSHLAGQNVRFVLTVRTEGDPLPYRALWIGPHILREEGAQPAPIPIIIPTETPSADAESQVPGVISGWVDLSSAPPYLNDPVTGTSSPVTVMFFNLDDGTWWWIHSTPNHPYYQMTVPPGNYHVVAYAQGVGDVPYVTGAYTGANPSCGLALKAVSVPPESMVDDIVIADWNWSCGGTAHRPDKPDSVPMP